MLKGRKRKKASKGHVIRVSDLTLDYINKQRLNNRRLSHDAYLRSAFGLPDRNSEAQWRKDGRPCLVVEGWLEVTTGQFYLDEKDANGASIVEAAKLKTYRNKKPIHMREIR